MYGPVSVREPEQEFHAVPMEGESQSFRDEVFWDGAGRQAVRSAVANNLLR